MNRETILVSVLAILVMALLIVGVRWLGEVFG